MKMHPKPMKRHSTHVQVLPRAPEVSSGNSDKTIHVVFTHEGGATQRLVMSTLEAKRLRAALGLSIDLTENGEQ